MYEIHVTIDPVLSTDPRRKVLEDLAQTYNYKIAKLFKEGGQEADEDSFMTAHTSTLADAKISLHILVPVLKAGGFVLRRYKIEQIIIDSKREDFLRLL